MSTTLHSAAAGRLPVVAGNWKMYKTAAEARATVGELLAALTPALVSGTVRGEVVICPPFTALAAVGEELSAAGAALGGGGCCCAARHGRLRLGLGAQDVHWEAQGAYTGEVSAAMLTDLGCGWVLIGHSERRAQWGETGPQVAAKVAAALDAGLVPVICVGETALQRQEGQTAAVLSNQVREAIAGIAVESLPELVLAYEPVWAIGSGLAAGVADAAAAAGMIRAQLPAAAAAQVRVLYGGSVKTGNVAEFMSSPAIDGVLVGGASLDGAGFAALALAGLAAKT